MLVNLNSLVGAIFLFFLVVSLCVFCCEKQQRRRKAAYTFIHARLRTNMWLISMTQCRKQSFFFRSQFLNFRPRFNEYWAFKSKKYLQRNLFEFFKSTLFNTASSHHLLPLRFHCVEGCWYWIHYTGPLHRWIGNQTLYNHSSRPYPQWGWDLADCGWDLAEKLIKNTWLAGSTWALLIISSSSSSSSLAVLISSLKLWKERNL
jgi:hypothetical protein